MLQKLAEAYKKLAEFSNESNYFYLVDKIHFLFAYVRPPRQRRKSRALWMILKVITTFQSMCNLLQFFRYLWFGLKDIDEFMVICNQTFINSATTIRVLFLAHHHDSMIQLKRYINSKSLLQDDPAAFELRKATFHRNNKYYLVFQLIATVNCIIWTYTDLFKADVLQIPWLLDYLPEKVVFSVKIFYAGTYNAWSVLVFISFTQMCTVLNSLRTELRIVVVSFESLFYNVSSKYAIELADLSELPQSEADSFWSELDEALKICLYHHSEFVRNFQKLKSIFSINILILFASTAFITTVNTLLFITDLSIVRLPLQLVAIQFAFEAYMCCSMLSSIHAENERISKHLYVIDWLGTIKRTSARQRRHAKSVRQNGQLLQRQVHGDLKIRAGGMFPIDLQTYSQLMRFVYSLLTFFRGR